MSTDIINILRKADRTYKNGDNLDIPIILISDIIKVLDDHNFKNIDMVNYIKNRIAKSVNFNVIKTQLFNRVNFKYIDILLKWNIISPIIMTEILISVKDVIKKNSKNFIKLFSPHLIPDIYLTYCFGNVEASLIKSRYRYFELFNHEKIIKIKTQNMIPYSKYYDGKNNVLNLENIKKKIYEIKPKGKKSEKRGIIYVKSFDKFEQNKLYYPTIINNILTYAKYEYSFILNDKIITPKKTEIIDDYQYIYY